MYFRPSLVGWFGRYWFCLEESHSINSGSLQNKECPKNQKKSKIKLFTPQNVGFFEITGGSEFSGLHGLDLPI